MRSRDEIIFAAERRQRRNRAPLFDERRRGNRRDRRFRFRRFRLHRVDGRFGSRHRANESGDRARVEVRPSFDVKIARPDSRRDENDRKRRVFSPRVSVKRRDVPPRRVAGKSDLFERRAALRRLFFQRFERGVDLVHHRVHRVNVFRLFAGEHIPERRGDVPAFGRSTREPGHILPLSGVPSAAVYEENGAARPLRRDFFREIKVELVPIVRAVRNAVDENAVRVRPIFQITGFFKRASNPDADRRDGPDADDAKQNATDRRRDQKPPSQPSTRRRLFRNVRFHLYFLFLF